MNLFIAGGDGESLAPIRRYQIYLRVFRPLGGIVLRIVPFRVMVVVSRTRATLGGRTWPLGKKCDPFSVRRPLRILIVARLRQLE